MDIKNTKLVKITKRQLRRIIKEEKQKLLREWTASREGYMDITIVAGPALENAAHSFSASMYFDRPGNEMTIPLQGGKLTATLNSDGVITVDIKG